MWGEFGRGGRIGAVVQGLVGEEVAKVHVELRGASAGVRLRLLLLPRWTAVLSRMAPRGAKVGCSRSESGGGEAHLDGGFAHAVEGVATCFRRRTFVHQIAQDGGRG